MLQNFLGFSDRSAYNLSLKHLRYVTSIVKGMAQGKLFAELINEINEADGLSDLQVLSIINVLLKDKFNLKNIPVNIFSQIDDIEKIVESLKKWNKFDITLVYHHPQLGICVLSNLIDEKWESFEDLKIGSYLVCYVKAVSEEDNKSVKDVIIAIDKIFSGKTEINDSQFVAEKTTVSVQSSHVDPAFDDDSVGVPVTEEKLDGNESDVPPPKTTQDEPIMPNTQSFQSVEEQVKKVADSDTKWQEGLKTGKMKMSPKYSCQVTNELFHNGNVEAWKNIIQSYNKTYPDVKVVVFHNGEKVNNINSLFKWGKVKSGDVILFSLIGPEFKGISKLQRYLFEGASNRFNKFLLKDLNKTLNLF